MSSDSPPPGPGLLDYARNNHHVPPRDRPTRALWVVAGLHVLGCLAVVIFRTERWTYRYSALDQFGNYLPDRAFKWTFSAAPYTALALIGLAGLPLLARWENAGRVRTGWVTAWAAAYALVVALYVAGIAYVCWGMKATAVGVSRRTRGMTWVGQQDFLLELACAAALSAPLIALPVLLRARRRNRSWLGVE
ncbi:MAG TPA: hypothetical protein VEA69_21560 [Tepidisphaeraceae bacterium]|nr:hypothetical protein [Tepidisphaeraceae bacterium]